MVLEIAINEGHEHYIIEITSKDKWYINVHKWGNGYKKQNKEEISSVTEPYADPEVIRQIAEAIFPDAQGGVKDFAIKRIKKEISENWRLEV